MIQFKSRHTRFAISVAQVMDNDMHVHLEDSTRSGLNRDHTQVA